MCVTMTPFHNCNKAALPPNPLFTPLCKILVYKATKPLAVVGMENVGHWQSWTHIVLVFFHRNLCAMLHVQ